MHVGMHGTYKVTSHNFTMTLCTIFSQHAINLHVLGTCTLIVNENFHTVPAVSAEDGVVTSLNSTFPITLTWGTKARNGTTFTVWYSIDSHESDPSTPPQGALVVSGLTSTSVTITLPDTDNSCKPYYVWISAITPNGQQSPYSRRRQVEVCRMNGCTGEHRKLTLSCLVSISILHQCIDSFSILSPDGNTAVTAAESASASIGAGSFLGGVVAGVVAALLVVGILYGCWKLKHSSVNSFNVDTKEEK